MSVRTLRRVLTFHSLLAIMFPCGVVLFFGFVWILPQIRKDAGERQLQLARVVGMQVESYLEAGAAIVRAAAAIPAGSGLTQQRYQQQLDTMLTLADAMSSLYVVAPDGKVSALALKKDEQVHRHDLISLDLSGNPLFREVTRKNRPLWSETFLSVVNGGLAAAYGAPGGGIIVFGEVDLTLLTRFLKRISSEKDILILVVDHKGQVVADNNGIYTAQQLNISNIPLVRTGIDSDAPTTGRFDFGGEALTGSIIQIPGLDWHVMVAKSDASLYRTPLNISLIVLAALLLAACSGIAISMQLASKLASRFETLIQHTRDIASGSQRDELPASAIAEFNQLSDSLSSMALTLQQQEAGLRESEETQRLILNSTCDGIYGIDIGGVCTFANEACVKLLGYERQEDLLGCNMHQLIHHSFADGVLMPMDECRANSACRDGVGVTVTDEVFWRKDGSCFAVEYSAHPIRKDGKLAGAVISWRDVTERKQAESERLKLEQQLLHAQKLESLGVLAGGIAHDFNNILTAIIGNADLALMRLNKESPAVENLHRIEQAAARAADLAKQMLAYSGKGKFFVENLDLNRLVEEMLHMLEVSISKKAVLRLNLHQPLPPVEADATQMRQILMNLVINASEAIGDKSGVIAITTGCMDCDRDYLKDVWLDENLQGGLYDYLEIADTGCGMDRETMAKLFDPFFTTKFTGRGLGMAAVLGIVRGHKGAIKVYSEPGKGTSFKILLPASGRPAELFNGDSRPDDWRGSGTVLLVDDEETVRGIGAEMLKELGFTTITAADGREAVETFKNSPEIRLVILDLTMPHMDGEECFRELRRLRPDLKVIISSGFNEHEVTQKFIGKGLAGFIQKPYKLSELKEALKGAC